MVPLQSAGNEPSHRSVGGKIEKLLVTKLNNNIYKIQKVLIFFQVVKLNEKYTH